MSQVSFASSAEKHSCCNTHLRPLLERINSIENRLLIQTERREKEYNELLHILLMIKKKKSEEITQKTKTDSQKLISPKSIIRDKGRPEMRKQIDKLKQKIGIEMENNECSAPQLANKEQNNIQNMSAGKAKIQIRKSSLNIKKRQSESRVKTIGQLKKKNEENVTERVNKIQQDMNQTKELSNYLMQQMLSLFERVNNVEYDLSSSPKGIPTQQTITSIVLDANQQQLLREAQKDSEQNPRLLRLEQMLQTNNEELRASANKINQQQNILSDLIALTRTLSSRISEIHLLSSGSPSPSK